MRLFGKQLKAYLAWKLEGAKRPPAQARIAARPGPPRRTSADRDEDFKAFIRTLPCCACGKPAPSEAAHTGSNGGMAMKADDTSSVPLCAECHRTGPLAYHVIGKRAFERVHGVRFASVRAALRREWRARRAA